MEKILQKEMLILEVSKRPVLYDKADMEYRNILIKENVWREIAEDQRVIDCLI